MLKRIIAFLLLTTITFCIVSCKDGQNEVDIEPLRELTETIYEESNYTPTSYKRYLDALNEAKEFIGSNNRNEYDYNNALRNLKSAIATLKLKPDKTDLAEKIIEAEKYEEKLNSYYIASSDKFVTALETARKWLADEDVTQEMVDAAIANLNEGINKLEIKADKTELVDLVNVASGVIKDDYMNSDWVAFDKALAGAQKIIDKESATANEISTVHIALTNVIENLVLKPDKTELQILYERANSIDTTLYSKSSLAVLDYAKAIAWDALYIAQVDQARIDEIESELNDAINGLQYKVTKTYTVICTATMIYNNNVGDQWGYYTTINDYDFSKKYTFEEEVGVTIQAEASVYENDEVTDWGSTFFDLIMTDGYTTSVEVTVRENRGTYAGNKAKWKMTYTVIEVVEEQSAQ